MKVLLCHNYYQHPGGEDQVFADESRLLQEHGHDVVHFERHNNDVDDMSQPALALRAVWNHGVYRELRALIRRERPQIMHCTNTFPLLSPAVYYAARKENVAVVQSLHNYRTICPNATFFREGKVCHKCLGKTIPWPSVIHGCYQHGRASNAVVTTMLTVHRALHTWKRTVDRYIAVSEFARQMFVAGGLPAGRITVKPNFVSPDPGIGDGGGGYAVFAGRLSPEKGLGTLLTAWPKLRSGPKLVILGDGPLGELVRRAANATERIEALGRRPLDEVYAIIGSAAVLVMPSECYETFGRTIAEAFAKGTPVVAARRGAMAELVDDGRTGLLFEPGDPDELSTKVDWLMEHPEARAAMRKAARAEYDGNYSSQLAYDRLLAVYEQALAAHPKALRPSPSAATQLASTPAACAMSGDGPSPPEQDNVSRKGAAPR